MCLAVVRSTRSHRTGLPAAWLRHYILGHVRAALVSPYCPFADRRTACAGRQDEMYSYVTVADCPKGFSGMGTKVVEDI